MIKEADQSEGSGSDDEVANQSVHFVLQQEKPSGYYVYGGSNRP